MSDFVVLQEGVGSFEWRHCDQPVYLNKPEIVEILESDGIEQNYNKVEHLSYFKMPQSDDYPMDLNGGFEKYKFREIKSIHELVPIETYLTKNNVKYSETDMTRIATLTSALTAIMKIPYSDSPSFSDFALHAIKFQDTIYIVRVRVEKRESPNDSYHYKFKMFCFSDSPETLPDGSRLVDENKKTRYLYQTQLKDFNLLYEAEIGGVISDHEIQDLNNLKSLNKCRFVSTGVLKELPDHYIWRIHPKMLQIWCKAYLCRISDIYIGFKNKDGFIRKRVEHTLVKDLPKGQKWKPVVCIQSLHKFLKIIKNKLRDANCPYTVHEFVYDSTEKCVKYKIHEGKTEFSFLKEDFIEHMQKMG